MRMCSKLTSPGGAKAVGMECAVGSTRNSLPCGHKHPVISSQMHL